MKKNWLLKKLDKFIGGSYIRLLPNAKPSESDVIKNILVIKTVAIGDLVLLLPAIRAIKELFPEAKLTLLTTPRVKEVVEDLSFLDEIIYYDILGKDKGLSGLRKIIQKVKEYEFDLSIDFEHYYNFTAIICRVAGIKNMAGFAIGKQVRQKLFNIKIPYQVDRHEVEAFFEAVGILANPPHPNPLPSRPATARSREGIQLVKIATSDEDSRAVDDFLKKNKISDKDLLIGIHPGTSDSAKVRRWLPERFAEIIDSLINDYKAKVIITGTADDKEVISKIKRLPRPDGSGLAMTSLRGASDEAISNGQPIVCKNFTLKQFAELCQRCNLFISVDTGPMHIAAAMGTKTIGLFGPNTPDKWGPYGFEHLAIYKKLDCSPCTKQYLGQISKCRSGKCMMAIEAGDVLEMVRRVFSVNCQPSTVN